MKANCYECKFRGEVPGSVHSSCKHKSASPANDSTLGNVFGILASVGRVPPIQKDIPNAPKFNPHGIKNGWANWPYNFDPTWLEECNIFESKALGGN